MEVKEVKAQMLGGEHINRCVGDPRFYETMPEFLPVKAILASAHTDPNSKKGCSSCHKRRVHGSVDGPFVTIAGSLSESRAKVLKSYLGIPEGTRFVIRGYNPATNRAFQREF